MIVCELTVVWVIGAGVSVAVTVCALVLVRVPVTVFVIGKIDVVAVVVKVPEGCVLVIVSGAIDVVTVFVPAGNDVVSVKYTVLAGCTETDTTVVVEAG